MSESLPLPLPIKLAKNVGLGLSDFRRGMRIDKNQRAALDTEGKLKDWSRKFAGGYMIPAFTTWAGSVIGTLSTFGFFIATHDAFPTFQPSAPVVTTAIIVGTLADAAIGLFAGLALTPQGRRGRHERERLAKNPSPIQLHK